MFGKGNDDETKAEKVQRLLDPGFVNRHWTPLDTGNGAHMRDVMRAYEQIKLTERLITEQVETNRLLRKLAGE